MISAPLKALLEAIRKHEAPKGYGQIYGGAKGVPKGTDVSKMTLGAVLKLQERMKAYGSASTACGGYQFINKTLKATIAQMGLPLNKVWDADLQDRMAIHLMEGRGLNRYMDGLLSAEAFANNLSMEWASLPVVRTSNIKGSSFYLKKVGQSFYAGDGLNKSFHKVPHIMALVYNLKHPSWVSPSVPAPAPVHVPEPEAAPRKRGMLLAAIEAIMSIFGRRK